MKKTLAFAAVMALGLSLAGPVFAADDELPLTGRVLIVAGGDVDIPSNEQADVVLVIGGDARIAGTVNALVVVDGTATVTDATLDTIAVIQGRAELTGDTTVLGDVVHFGSTVTRADGVQISGTVRDMAGDVVGIGAFIAAAIVVLWLGIGVATLLFGLLVAGLAARQVRSATILIGREPVMAFLVGLLSIVVLPVLAVLAMVTLIGIPTGIGLVLVIWPTLAFVGYVVAAIWLGEWLLSRRDGAAPAERPYAAAALGLLIAFVIGFVPLVTAVLSILGIGAVIVASWRTLRGRPEPQPALRAEPVPTA